MLLGRYQQRILYWPTISHINQNSTLNNLLIKQFIYLYIAVKSYDVSMLLIQQLVLGCDAI